MSRHHEASNIVSTLAQAGFVAAHEEAEELIAFAGADGQSLSAIVERRLTGEPLGWITGTVSFCGVDVKVDRGVYVPRWQSEPLASAAAERLPHSGLAIDLCTGTGAIAKVLMAHHPGARVVASEIDERSVACARSNGVEVYRGDLFEPLPAAFVGNVDVVVGVLPYVPTSALALLAHDTFTFESPLSYDGGTDGMNLIRRALPDAARFLRSGGALLLEVGGDQANALEPELDRSGFRDVGVLTDDEGDVRGIEATRG